MTQTLLAWIEQHTGQSSFERQSSKEVSRVSPMNGVELVVADLVATAAGDDADVVGRLGDLGLCEGESFQYFGRSPLGEPVYICVRDTVIALRYSEASLIRIVGENR